MRIILTSGSVIVDDFDVVDAILRPNKANPPLIIDPNAICARPISLQRFQPVRRGHSEILQLFSGIQHVQLPAGGLGDLMKSPVSSCAVQFRSILATKSTDHSSQSLVYALRNTYLIEIN